MPPCMCLPTTVSGLTGNATGQNTSVAEAPTTSPSSRSSESESAPSPIACQDRYQFIRELGKGSFGRVILARDTEEDGRQVAIKLIARRKYNQYTEREVENHLQLIHPHIIRLYDLFLTKDHLALVLEYADQGDLYSFLVKHRRLSEAGARWLVQQVAIALEFLHKAGISLRDLKLENILLRGSPTKPIVKLCDLGFSKSDVLHSAPDSTVGTLAYTAPEVITGKVYDGKQTDAWALGVLLYVLVAGAYPFERSADKELHPVKRQRAQMQRIMKCELRAWPSEASKPSPECMELIHGLLTVDPKSRLSITQALRHPWLTEGLPKGALQMNEKFAVPQLTAPLPRHVASILRRARDGGPAYRSALAGSRDRSTSLGKVSAATSAATSMTTATNTTGVERASMQTDVSKSSATGRLGRTSAAAYGSSPPRGGWRPAELIAMYDSLVCKLTSSSKRQAAAEEGVVPRKKSSLLLGV